MKKSVSFALLLIFLCFAAYFGGYRMAASRAEKMRQAEKNYLHQTVRNVEMTEKVPGEHYVAKIEQETLFIYEMPEHTVYDFMEIKTLHFPENERAELKKGLVFETLAEVYEFLENSMS